MTSPVDGSSANAVRLVAEYVARDALRWSPAGIPIIDATVTHRSRQFEAGIARDVTLELPIRAAGPLAHRLDVVPLGARLELLGFLAPRSRSGRGLVLHLTRFDLATGDVGADRAAAPDSTATGPGRA